MGGLSSREGPETACSNQGGGGAPGGRGGVKLGLLRTLAFPLGKAGATVVHRAEEGCGLTCDLTASSSCWREKGHQVARV